MILSVCIALCVAEPGSASILRHYFLMDFLWLFCYKCNQVLLHERTVTLTTGLNGTESFARSPAHANFAIIYFLLILLLLLQFVGSQIAF